MVLEVKRKEIEENNYLFIYLFIYLAMYLSY
jgi:hypothetical protein